MPLLPRRIGSILLRVQSVTIPVASITPREPYDPSKEAKTQSSIVLSPIPQSIPGLSMVPCQMRVICRQIIR